MLDEFCTRVGPLSKGGFTAAELHRTELQLRLLPFSSTAVNSPLDSGPARKNDGRRTWRVYVCLAGYFTYNFISPSYVVAQHK